MKRHVAREAHGRVAGSGSASRTGAAVEIGDEPAQLAVMSAQPIGAPVFKKNVRILGAPGLFDRRGRHGGDGGPGVIDMFDPAELGLRPLRLQPPRQSLGLGHGRPASRLVQPAPIQTSSCVFA